MVAFAGEGEKASAGTVHYDNVGAAVAGRFVVVKYLGLDEFLGGSSDVPLQLWSYDVDLDSIVLAIPKIKIPKMKTKVSRGVLPKTVKFTDAMKDLRNAASIVARLAGNTIVADNEAIHSGSELIYAMGEIHDESISERARKKLIPGYDKVKKLARTAGAYAVTISGAGPTVIAFSGSEAAKEVGASMKKGFKSANVDCDIVICKPSKGPEIVKVVK